MDSTVQRTLYQQMVMIRTYEEVILHVCHADKKPVFDIGVGLAIVPQNSVIARTT